MGTQLKARPTEYKGIRFRSKSEAVFARCLDLSPVVAEWEYETEQYCRCPHPFDFFVRFVDGGTAIIEYKPSEPSATYIDEITNAMIDHAFDVLVEHRRTHYETYIVFGSPWNPASAANAFEAIPILSAFNEIRLEGVLRITAEHANDASQYRFDLAHSKSEPRHDVKAFSAWPEPAFADPFAERIQACRDGELSPEEEMQLLKDILEDTRSRRRIALPSDD